MIKRYFYFLAIAGAALLLAACTKPEPASSPQAAALPAALAGTSWQLVVFQSMDDSIGILAPADPSKYQMTLAADGTVSMQLDCNRANGSWTATAAAPDNGSFAFGPLAMTMALCPEPSLSGRIAHDSEFVRSYLLRDGRLFLSLFADAGIYQWEPL
jgi:heat shock protein HslJ